MEFMNKNEKRQARILALQAFFCFEQRKFECDIKSVFDEVVSFSDVEEERKNEEILKVVADNPSDLSENVKDYAFQVVKFAAANLKDIDKELSKCTENWALERLNAIDRNLLRISVAEMDGKFYVPPKVVINEAIEIAKIFGTNDSAKFVNAVLDRIKNEKTNEKQE